MRVFLLRFPSHPSNRFFAPLPSCSLSLMWRHLLNIKHLFLSPNTSRACKGDFTCQMQRLPANKQKFTLSSSATKHRKWSFHTQRTLKSVARKMTTQQSGKRLRDEVGGLRVGRGVGEGGRKNNDVSGPILGRENSFYRKLLGKSPCSLDA